MREIFILSVNTNAPNKSHNINNTQSMHKVSTRFNILKLVTGFWYFPLCNFLIKNILQHSHNICNWIINRIYKLTKCFIICQIICIKLSGQTVIPSDYVIDLYIYTPWTCLTGWGAKCPRSFVEIQFGNNEILDYYMLPVTFGHRNSKSGSKPIDILNQWGQMVCTKQNINYAILWTDSLLAPFIPLFVFFSPLATLFMARFFAIAPASRVLVLSDLFNVQNICKWTRHELVQWYGNKINDQIFHDGLRAIGDVFNGDKTFFYGRLSIITAARAKN